MPNSVTFNCIALSRCCLASGRSQAPPTHAKWPQPGTTVCSIPHGRRGASRRLAGARRVRKRPRTSTTAPPVTILDETLPAERGTVLGILKGIVYSPRTHRRGMLQSSPKGRCKGARKGQTHDASWPQARCKVAPKHVAKWPQTCCAVPPNHAASWPTTRCKVAHEGCEVENTKLQHGLKYAAGWPAFGVYIIDTFSCISTGPKHL